MRNPGGYFHYFGPDGDKERDSFTCGHHNKVVKVEPFCDPADAGGLCKQCMQLICAECAARGICDPFEEKLRRYEARTRLFQAIGV